jgi:hypothetical protein
VYVPNEDSSNVSEVNGSTVVGSLNVGRNPTAGTYDSGNGFVYVPNEGSDNMSAFFTAAVVGFTEKGLPPGMGWWINVTRGSSAFSDGTTLSFGSGEGSFSYSVAASDKTYSAPGGSFRVSGMAVSETVTFSRVTSPVTFSETGLATGTNWSVTLGGITLASMKSTIAFVEPNGTYAYVIGVVPGWKTDSHVGSILVRGGPVPMTISWRRAIYTVVFAESGLPAATEWWVNVTGNASTASDSTTLSFSEPNGTYSYSVSTVDKTYSSQSVGGNLFWVNGTTVAQAVAFSRVTYLVTFTETGLPTGTNWSVTFGGVSGSGKGNLSFQDVPNGTYVFAVGSLVGYSANRTSGPVHVHGAPMSVSIAFTLSASTDAKSNSSAIDGFVVLGGTSAVVLVAVAVFTLMGRRGKTSPEPAAHESTTPR